jgi:hypothetical protein
MQSISAYALQQKLYLWWDIRSLEHIFCVDQITLGDRHIAEQVPTNRVYKSSKVATIVLVQQGIPPTSVNSQDLDGEPISTELSNNAHNWKLYLAPKNIKNIELNAGLQLSWIVIATAPYWTHSVRLSVDVALWCLYISYLGVKSSCDEVEYAGIMDVKWQLDVDEDKDRSSRLISLTYVSDRRKSNIHLSRIPAFLQYVLLVRLPMGVL